MSQRSPIRGSAIFLDRDGTLTRDFGYTHKITDFRLLDNVVEGLRLFVDMGFRLIVASNQSGIARGYFTERDMERFNDHLIHVLSAHAIHFTGMYCSPYHPTYGRGEYRKNTSCRKPKPGMLVRAAAEHDINLNSSYMIGDKRSDILAGKAAGCTTILVLTGAAGAGEPELAVTPDYIACDLLDAALKVRNAESCDVKRTEQGIL